MKKPHSHPLTTKGILVGALLACSASCLDEDKPKIIFKNRSNTSATYDIVFDGTRIGAIQPFENLTHETSSGRHWFRFEFANGSTACSKAWVTLDDGDEEVRICDS